MRPSNSAVIKAHERWLSVLPREEELEIDFDNMFNEAEKIFLKEGGMTPKRAASLAKHYCAHQRQNIERIRRLRKESEKFLEEQRV